MVSTVIAVSLPVLLIEPVNYYTCEKWLLTKTVDSNISWVDSRDRSIAQIGKLVLPTLWRKGSKVYRKVQIHSLAIRWYHNLFLGSRKFSGLSAGLLI